MKIITSSIITILFASIFLEPLNSYAGKIHIVYLTNGKNIKCLSLERRKNDIVCDADGLEMTIKKSEVDRISQAQGHLTKTSPQSKISGTTEEQMVSPSEQSTGSSGSDLPVVASVGENKGEIVWANNKCFVVENISGYILVDGWVNVPEGSIVYGDFNKYGFVKMFDSNGNDVTGYIYIEDWGLSKSRVIEKIDQQCN